MRDYVFGGCLGCGFGPEAKSQTIEVSEEVCKNLFLHREVEGDDSLMAQTLQLPPFHSLVWPVSSELQI